METTDPTKQLDGSGQNPYRDEQVRAQLGRIIESRAFKASARIRRLLDHLVTGCLEHRERELTQRHLAAAVFGRESAFDPDRDAIVRVEMRKLRQALDLYYAGAGTSDPIVLSIPSGRYVPTFEFRATASAGTTGSGAVELPGHLADPVGIAVLPFRDVDAGTSDSGRLGRGIGEELNTILSRIPELRIAPPYAFPGGVDMRDVVSRLRAGQQVRYVLEGTTRCAGDSIRVTARLHDLAREEQIWSGRYDRSLSTPDVLGIQEDIARHVVAEAVDLFTGAIGRSLRGASSKQLGPGLEVHEALLRFHTYLHVTSDEAYGAAREALEVAHRSEPSNPVVLAMLADLRRAAYALGFTDEPDRADQVLSMVREAIALAPDCLPCRISLCFALLHSRDKVALLHQAEIILADQTSPTSYRSDVAVPLALSGEWERGCGLLAQQVGEFNIYPHYFQYPFFLRDYAGGDYEGALRLAEGFRPVPFFWQPMLHAAALGKVGRGKAAAEQLETLLQIRPKLAQRVRRYLASYLMQDELIDDLIDGLRRAGLPRQ